MGFHTSSSRNRRMPRYMFMPHRCSAFSGKRNAIQGMRNSATQPAESMLQTTSQTASHEESSPLGLICSSIWMPSGVVRKRTAFKPSLNGLNQMPNSSVLSVRSRSLSWCKMESGAVSHIRAPMYRALSSYPNRTSVRWLGRPPGSGENCWKSLWAGMRCQASSSRFPLRSIGELNRSPNATRGAAVWPHTVTLVHTQATAIQLLHHPLLINLTVYAFAV